MRNTEKELRAAKRFNKVAVVLIIFMLSVMSAMLNSMKQCVVQYELLERRYEKLYEEVKGQCEVDGSI